MKLSVKLDVKPETFNVVKMCNVLQLPETFNDVKMCNVLQLLPPERQKGCRNLLGEYYQSLCKHLLTDHKELKNMERQNRRILQVGLSLSSVYSMVDRKVGGLERTRRQTLYFYILKRMGLIEKFHKKSLRQQFSKFLSQKFSEINIIFVDLKIRVRSQIQNSHNSNRLVSFK